MGAIKNLLIEFLGEVCEGFEDQDTLQQAILSYDPETPEFEGEVPTTLEQYHDCIYAIGLDRIAENPQLLPPIGLGEMQMMLAYDDGD